MNNNQSNPMFVRNKNQRILFGRSETPISSYKRRRSTLLSTPASNVKRQSSNFQPIPTITRPSSSQTPLRNQTQDLRPIKDKKYQELLQKEIYSFLVENRFEIKTNITLTENTLKSPTQKNFNGIFKFLYNQLDPYYIFQKPVEQEIIIILKNLQYPYLRSISRSHFSAVGGANWPDFLSILWWLVKLNLEILNLTENDFLTDDEFDRIHIKYISDSYNLFMTGEEEEEDIYYDGMKSELIELRKKLDYELKDLMDQRDLLLEKIEQLNQEMNQRTLIEEKSIALEDDYVKLKAFNENVEKRIPDWNSTLKQLSNEVELSQDKLTELTDEKKNFLNELSNSNKSVDQINELFVIRDKVSKDIENMTEKVDNLKIKLTDRLNEIDLNFDNLNKLCNNYNHIIKKSNYYTEYKFSISINEYLKDESKGFNRDQIFTKDIKEEISQLQKIEIEINHKINQEKEITRKQNEEIESIMDKIKEQTLNLEELKLQDDELKKKIEETQQQMYSDQENYTKEINKLDHQSREIKNSISADILELEGKLRDTYVYKSKIQDEMTLKRQEMNEQQTRIISFIINFRRNIQEKLIKVDDLIQIELEKI